MYRRVFTLLAVFDLSVVAAFSQSFRLDMDLRKPGVPIQNTQYGIFFEDINFAADGGLYAELVKNRSFEYPDLSIGCRHRLLLRPERYKFKITG